MGGLGREGAVSVSGMEPDPEPGCGDEFPLSPDGSQEDEIFGTDPSVPYGVISWTAGGRGTDDAAAENGREKAQRDGIFGRAWEIRIKSGLSARSTLLCSFLELSFHSGSAAKVGRRPRV